jgi:hypothetical protein
MEHEDGAILEDTTLVEPKSKKRKRRNDTEPMGDPDKPDESEGASSSGRGRQNRKHRKGEPTDPEDADGAANGKQRRSKRHRGKDGETPAGAADDDVPDQEGETPSTEPDGIATKSHGRGRRKGKIAEDGTEQEEARSRKRRKAGPAGDADAEEPSDVKHKKSRGRKPGADSGTEPASDQNPDVSGDQIDDVDETKGKEKSHRRTKKRKEAALAGEGNSDLSPNGKTRKQKKSGHPEKGEDEESQNEEATSSETAHSRRHRKKQTAGDDSAGGDTDAAGDDKEPGSTKRPKEARGKHTKSRGRKRGADSVGEAPSDQDLEVTGDETENLDGDEATGKEKARRKGKKRPDAVLDVEGESSALPKHKTRKEKKSGQHEHQEGANEDSEPEEAKPLGNVEEEEEEEEETREISEKLVRQRIKKKVMALKRVRRSISVPVQIMRQEYTYEYEEEQRDEYDYEMVPQSPLKPAVDSPDASTVQDEHSAQLEGDTGTKVPSPGVEVEAESKAIGGSGPDGEADNEPNVPGESREGDGVDGEPEVAGESADDGGVEDQPKVDGESAEDGGVEEQPKVDGESADQGGMDGESHQEGEVDSARKDDSTPEADGARARKAALQPEVIVDPHQPTFELPYQRPSQTEPSAPRPPAILAFESFPNFDCPPEIVEPVRPLRRGLVESVSALSRRFHEADAKEGERLECATLTPVAKPRHRKPERSILTPMGVVKFKGLSEV